MSAGAQYLALSKRSLLNTIRQPIAIVPPLVFPLMFLALTSAALERSTELPGFPQVDSFVQFVIVTTITQGILFSSVGAGAGVARDIEDGFFERLIATPVSRLSLIVGRVSATALVGFLQAWLFLGIASLFGLRVESGFLGMLSITLCAGILAAGIGALTVSFGLRTGSTEAAQGIFPLVFSLLFVSSGFFPRNLMDGWFQSAASINPISHYLEGLRAQVIGDFQTGEFLMSLAIAIAIFVFGVTLSILALRRRLGEAA